MATDRRLVLLCHRGDWDYLYQAASAAAAAATLGWRVEMVFFFGALTSLVESQLDEVRSADPELTAKLAAGVETAGTTSTSEILAAARQTGEVRLYACSASSKIMGISVDDASSHVDEVIGWPTVVRLMDGADQVLYL